MTKKTSRLILIALLMISLFNQCSKDDNTEEPANNNPTAAFSVNPSSGGLQTSFAFDASASHDPETADQELMVRWDFNGDGIWDTEYSDNKTATHQYASTGTFEAKLMVQDTDKNTDETSQSVTVSAGAPTASILVTPASGNTETLFEFDASGSYDEQTPTEDLLVRWDYDGNGSWDTDYSTSKISSHTYTTAGEFNATLEVKDEDNISSTASTLVNVVEAPAGCPETFVDPRDGQEYHAIEIGDQCWMAENLNIGSRINGSQNTSDDGNIEKYCYENNEVNCDEYGGLYNWNELMQYTTEEGAQGICPDGWHVPTDVEWMMLEMELGMSYEDATSSGYRGTDEAAKLREGGSSGFSALMGGYKSSGSQFLNLMTQGAFFTSNQSTSNTSNAYVRFIFSDNDKIYRNHYNKNMAMSLRCLQNQ